MRYEIRPLGAWTDKVTDPRHAAAAKLHPDRGGHHDQMAQLTIAKQILDDADLQ